MDNNLHNNNDGLEDFFHDKLFGYQDEPGLDMWNRIESQIPEKPTRDLKPVIVWTSRAVAACLIFTLGFFNYQYSSQLEHVAQKLQNSENSMASLEQRLNDFYRTHISKPTITEESIPNPIASNHLNTKPKNKKSTATSANISIPTFNNNQATVIVASETESTKIEQEVKSSAVAVANTSPSQETTQAFMQMPAMAFASSYFNVTKKDANMLNNVLRTKT